MESDNKLEEIDDPYFLAYQILAMSLKNREMNDNGFAKALYLIKIEFNASDVLVYKKSDYGEYVHSFNEPLMKDNSTMTTVVLNTSKSLIEKKKYYDMKLNIGNNSNVLFIPITLEDASYMIAITNNKNMPSDKKIDLYIETIRIVLDMYEMIKQLKKSADVDSLTGLNNRMAYDKAIGNEPATGLIYVIFDLFRLKMVNDKYGHDFGDRYIKGTADILKKYFPKKVPLKVENGRIVKLLTGSCVYRVGGDEFVLMAENETYESMQVKLLIVQEEVKNLDLSIDERLGVNYGMAIKLHNESYHDLYLEADSKLSENKIEMYRQLGINRRK